MSFRIRIQTLEGQKKSKQKKLQSRHCPLLTMLWSIDTLLSNWLAFAFFIQRAQYISNHRRSISEILIHKKSDRFLLDTCSIFEVRYQGSNFSSWSSFFWGLVFIFAVWFFRGPISGVWFFQFVEFFLGLGVLHFGSDFCNGPISGVRFFLGSVSGSESGE